MNDLGVKQAQLETELHSLRRFHERIVERLEEGIAVEDTSGCSTFLNRRAAEMLGYEQQELPYECIGKIGWRPGFSREIPAEAGPPEHFSILSYGLRSIACRWQIYDTKAVHQDGGRGAGRHAHS